MTMVIATRSSGSPPQRRHRGTLACCAPPYRIASSRSQVHVQGDPAGAQLSSPPLGDGLHLGRRLVIREELGRLLTLEERHRRLAARLVLAPRPPRSSSEWPARSSTYQFELGVKGGDIHGLGDAAFFTARPAADRLVADQEPADDCRVASSTSGSRSWSIFVVTAVAGSFASFFSSGDSG